MRRSRSWTRGLTQRAEHACRGGRAASTTESVEESHDALQVELGKSLSELQDLDYAEAIGRMNQQLTGLQAAQAAYTPHLAAVAVRLSVSGVTLPADL